MTSVPNPVDGKTLLLGVLLLGVAVGVGVATVTISDVDPDDLAAAQGTLNDSSNLSVTRHNVSYDGLEATKVNVTITNSDSNSHTGNVYVSVKNASNATTLESKSVISKSISANSDGYVEVTINRRVDAFDVIETNVVETG